MQNTHARHPLEYARKQRGLSQADLAAQVRKAAAAHGMRSGTDRNRVWRWENNRAMPDAESQLYLAEVFGVPDSEVHRNQWPDWLPGTDHVLPLGPGSAVRAIKDTVRGAMDRRSFVSYGATGLISLATQWAGISPAHATSNYKDQETIVAWFDHTEQSIAAMTTERRQYMADVMDGHMASIASLLESGRLSPANQKRIHATAARLSRTIGWYRFDQGQHNIAARHWHSAVHNAHEAGDRIVGSLALSDLSYQQLWMGDPATSLALSERATNGINDKKAAACMLLRKARAEAALNRETACNTTLHQAERLIDTADSSPSHTPWMTWSDYHVDRGRCLIDLGHKKQAIDTISSGVSGLSYEREKTIAIFHVYQATALASMGEKEEAGRLLEESIKVSERLGAPRSISIAQAELDRINGQGTH